MRPFLLITLIASMLAIFTVASRSRPVRSESPVFAGLLRSVVRYTSETRSDPPVRMHVVQVDLTSPRIGLSVATAGPVADDQRAGGWTTTLQTVRTIAQHERFEVAVNGDFFSHDAGELGQLTQYRTGAPAHTMGPLVCDARSVNPGSPANFPALLVDEYGRCAIDQFPAIPAGARQFICGNVQIVRHGKVNTEGLRWTSTERAPVTAVGLDRDRHTLTFLVVDGRRDDYSVGLTLTDAAAELVRLGCYSALNLDGGGSSTLVFHDARDDSYHVANRPSDGHQLSDSLAFERPVASALGIRLLPCPAPASNLR